jgi:hypothetical protein
VAIEYSRCGVLLKMQYKNDFFPETNAPLIATLDLIDVENQGIENGIKQSAAIRFLAKLGSSLRDEDIEKELIDNFRPALSAQMSAAAKTHINSASTDVSIAGDLREIAADGVRNSALRATLMNMGLMISASGIALWLNPIGESAKVIEEINARYNQQALEEFDDAKTEKQRQWDKEDRQMENQHEIDVINAQNTNTQNHNNSNTYNYNGNVPRQEVHIHEKRKAPRYCPICGCKLDEDAKFCPKCGNKVN